MRKIIFLVIAFAGLNAAGYAQTTAPSKTDVAKTTVIKKHLKEKNGDSKITNMHKNDNKAAVNATTAKTSTSSTSSAAKYPSMAKNENASKMHNHGTMLDSAHATKKNPKTSH